MGSILLVYVDGIDLLEINFENRRLNEFENPASEFIEFITNSINHQYDMIWGSFPNFSEANIRKALKASRIEDQHIVIINLDFEQMEVS